MDSELEVALEAITNLLENIKENETTTDELHGIGGTLDSIEKAIDRLDNRAISVGVDIDQIGKHSLGIKLAVDAIRDAVRLPRSDGWGLILILVVLAAHVIHHW